MGSVTESIYNYADAVIPLADVQFMYKVYKRRADGGTESNGIHVFMRGGGEPVQLDKEEAPKFMSAWCRYRAELEAETLMDPSQDAPQPQAGVTKMELLVSAMVPTLAGIFLKENKNSLGAYPEWKEGVVMDAVKFAEIIVEACKGR